VIHLILTLELKEEGRWLFLAYNSECRHRTLLELLKFKNTFLQGIIVLRR